MTSGSYPRTTTHNLHIGEAVKAAWANQETRQKIVSGMKGIPKTEEQRRKVSGENSLTWKGGTNIAVIHRWAKRQLTKPDSCPACGSTGRLDCCNVDHKYRRVIEDYFYACQQCHMKWHKEHNLR
jgi:hypothetical protein